MVIIVGETFPKCRLGASECRIRALGVVVETRVTAGCGSGYGVEEDLPGPRRETSRDGLLEGARLLNC